MMYDRRRHHNRGNTHTDICTMIIAIKYQGESFTLGAFEKTVLTGKHVEFTLYEETRAWHQCNIYRQI